MTSSTASDDDLVVVFRPVVDVANGAVIGYEALPVSASAPAEPGAGYVPLPSHFPTDEDQH